MPKRKQKQKKSNPLTMVGNPPPPPPPLVCNITTTTTSTTSSNSASNHHYNNNGNNNSQGNTRGQTTNHDTTTNTTTNRNTIDRMPPIAFPPPATGTTTTTTTTFHIPSSHAEILKKYSISEKTFSKLKATFDSVIPRAVQNSLESLMDMAVHEHPNAPSSHNLPSFTPTTTNTTRRGGLPTGDLVQEEFTIAGNTLLPTMSHRFGHGGNVASATGGKKRPRDFTPGHASSTTCPNVLHHGENSNSMRSNRQQEMDSLNVSGVMLGDDDDDDDDDDLECVVDLDDEIITRGENEEDEEEEDDDDEEEDDDEEDYDPDDHVVGVCLHCGRGPPAGMAASGGSETDREGEVAGGESSAGVAAGIQVSCDECHSFICSSCHWCHEYQANHEIRVCDRCDAFYCKNCDEMDQCEDCGEVVCAGCGALCSCKFCGCGLCEDCATACGRCGIVLCQRDSKFAVECDTCKMSYCLVCLASGTKDPCVRCGHRTSKRVEQLVHLRLKSIYKAFKQSGAALEHSSNKAGNGGGSGSWKKGRNVENNNNHEDNRSMERGRNNDWNGQASSECSAVEGGGGTKGVHSSVMNGDVEAVLQVAAAAAATSGAAAMGWGKAFNCDSASSSKMNDPFGGFPRGMHSGKVMPHLNHDGSISFRPRKEPKKNESDKFASRTEAEADAAAAALLAELDKEKEQQEASNRSKKSKKKKKKERQAAKEKEKEDKSKNEDEEKSLSDANDVQAQIGKLDEEYTVSPDDASIEKEEDNENEDKSVSSGAAPGEEENDDALLAGFMETSTETEDIDKMPSRNISNDDDIEGRLAQFITANDVDAIESILAELKGIPGRAALRKNAKKALKKIKEESSNNRGVDNQQELSVADESPPDMPSETNDAEVLEYKSSEPLLKLVSSNHRAQTTTGVLPRSECVMHMAPGVVGWVIGKGGQRIRDVMEESGAKVWIDQDSMGPQDMRIVYVSGSKKSVSAAVRSIKDLVAKAPVGGTTNAPGSVPTVVNDSGSVTSTRSSLTSTPISFSTSVIQQAPVAATTSNMSPSKRTAVKHKTSNSGKISGREDAISLPTLNTRSMSMPPPGMENLTRGTTPVLIPQTGARGKTPPKVVRELFCEPRFVPLLIGRRGWTVKNIQDTSGARVDIDQKVIPRKITISGGESQVNDAVRQVQEVLSYPHAQQNYSTSRNQDNDGYERVDEVAQADQDNPGLSQMAAFSYVIPPNSRFLNDPLIPRPLDQPITSPFSQHQLPSDYSTGPEPRFVQNLGTPTTPSSAFLNRQSSAPLPLHTAEMQFNAAPIREVESNMVGASEAFNNQFLRGSFSHEESRSNDMRYNTILPLTGKSQLPFMNGGQGSPPMTHGNLAGREPLFSVPQDTHSEHDLLSNLFGRGIASQGHASSGADQLLQAFGNLSFGEDGSSDFGLGGANWDWEGLVSDEKSSSRSFGLGGVRLDNSSEVPDNNNNSNTNTNRNDMSQW
eukprot:CAMPEP_0176496752 /NCGR_PEP_ID=MMETSP0200_2-20121128/11359_1 /TAXON_ID=947934 /ORGANISM="Chaetoceros sp., Strain GSL56" /LENGTH=1468 /DNA_ID=CAMNT_0017894721 /DNA_START=294 /DNA_END=4697 /DNA_ORIENTATION=-